MTPQTEQQLRREAQARGWDKTKEDAYVQYVGSKIQASSPEIPQPAPKQKEGDGFLKTIIKDPVKELLVRPAVRTAQAGIALLGGERGRDFAMKDQKVNLPLLGDFNIPGQKTGTAGVKQIAGDALKTASYLYTPKAGAGALKAGFAGAVRQGAIQGLKAGAIGGASYSAGQALQDDRSLKDTGLETLKGAAVGGAAGAVLGGGLGAVSAGISKVKGKLNSAADDIERSLPDKAMRQLEKRYDEMFASTKAGKRVLDTSAGRGKNPSKFLSEHGYIVDVEGGKINASNTIGKINENVQPLEDVLDDILKAKDATLPSQNRISLEDLARKAKSALNTPENKASGNLSKMLREVDDIVSELKVQFGDDVNYSALNSIKRGQWSQTGFDPSRPKYSSEINYQLGKAAKNTLEEVVQETDIRQLNQYIGDHLDTIRALEKINGNAVKGGRLGNYTARVIGATVGSSHGPLGSVTGAVTGDMVANIMQNSSISNPIKRAMLQKIIQKSGTGSPAFKAAQEALLKIKTDRLSLPAASATNAALKGNRNVIINRDVINLPDKPFVSPGQPFKGKGALSRTLTEEAAQVTGVQPRPAHQVKIENLINDGKYDEAMKIAQGLADSDPYKKSTLSVIKSYAKDVLDGMSDTNIGLSIKDPRKETNKLMAHELMFHKLTDLENHKAALINQGLSEKHRSVKNIDKEWQRVWKTIGRLLGAVTVAAGTYYGTKD